MTTPRRTLSLLLAIALGSLALAGCSIFGKEGADLASEEEQANRAFTEAIGSRKAQALLIGGTQAQVSSSVCTGTDAAAGFAVKGTVNGKPFELTKDAATGSMPGFSLDGKKHVVVRSSYANTTVYIDVDLAVAEAHGKPETEVRGIFPCDQA